MTHVGTSKPPKKAKKLECPKVGQGAWNIHSTYIGTSMPLKWAKMLKMSHSTYIGALKWAKEAMRLKWPIVLIMVTHKVEIEFLSRNRVLSRNSVLCRNSVYCRNSVLCRNNNLVCQ